jgi:signal transduction protein with GAF and PtsI domain
MMNTFWERILFKNGKSHKISIKNRRWTDDKMEKKEKSYFRLFRDTCKAINSSLNLSEVLDLITVNVTVALDVKACSVFLWDRKRDTLDVGATHGLNESYLKKGPLDADRSIAGTLQGNSVLILDTADDPRVQYPDEAKKEGIASIFSVPISLKDHIIGVLRIYMAEKREFTEDQVEFINGLADMCGIAIDNARMYDLLKVNHEKLITETHQWFEFGKMP